MNIELSYDKEFGDLIDTLHGKYGEAIFDIEGIGRQLDLNKFSKEFFGTKVTADASIDANANVGDSTVVSYSVELTKPFEKLNSLYLLWKEMKRLYHTDVANNIIEMHISGDIYIHDLHSVNKSYCFAYSTYDIMNKGLPMVTKIKSIPPKYLYSFKSQLEQFVVIASNSTLGASSINDCLVMMSYYVKNILETKRDAHFTFASEDDIWAYVKETLVSLVYTLNQPFRGGIQCVTEDTRILTPSGLKYYSELSIGDLVYTFKDGEFRTQPIQRLNVSKYNGDMHRYGAQVVTPNHRVVYKTKLGMKIKLSDDIDHIVDIPHILYNDDKIFIDRNEHKYNKEVISYDGIVWCPTTEDGVVIFNHEDVTFVSGNSAFTNVSLYDKEFLQTLSDMYIFEDGSTLDIDIVNKIQDIYIDVMNETLRLTPATFPVTTACFSIDNNNEFKDKEFVKYIIEKNKEFGFINLYSGKSSVISACCFDGSQLVLTKSSDGVKLCSIYDVCNGDYKLYRNNLTVFHNGSWVKCKTVKVPYTDTMYKITTYNNKTLYVTKDHIHLTDSGDLSTEELSLNDYIAFNTRVLDTYPEADLHLTYNQGFFIGMFIGDGSFDKDASIIFSLNSEKLEALDIINAAIADWNIVYDAHVRYDKNNVIFVKIHNKELTKIIQSYVSGRTAITKDLSASVLTQSKQFRQGIIDGWYHTDGGNSNRIYSINKNLINIGEAICTSLGMQTVINVSDRTNEPVIIRGEEYKRNYPLYCLRFYNLMNKRTIANHFKVYNNTEYFKIRSIEVVESTDAYVYCFETLNDEPYFTLPNGVITHNCRLKCDTESLGYVNSIGGSSNKIGSVGVTTINMYRLAKKSKDVDDFKAQLAQLVGVCARVNHARRTIIRKKTERGFAPLYTYDFISLDKQFSTCGLNGFYEAMCYLNIDITTDKGIKDAIDIIEIINSENKKFDKSFGYSHNCEQIPGESASVKIAQKDKILGYNNEYDLYSNQFLPLTMSADILERIKIQGALDNHFSGGSVLHLNFDKRIDDVNKIYILLEDAVRQGVVYMAINYVLNECENGHISVGNIEMCSTCGGKINNQYTRTVGFLSNVKNWNKVRRTLDFPNRKFYSPDGV
jgi:anaerobic ribonucleoside-triphosphate reductase